MISTNRIFESAHGPEIPNFLEIVAGLYSIGLPRRLGGRSSKLNCCTKKFSGSVGHIPKKSGKFLSAPLIFSFPYAHGSKCPSFTCIFQVVTTYTGAVRMNNFTFVIFRFRICVDNFFDFFT